MAGVVVRSLRPSPKLFQRPLFLQPPITRVRFYSTEPDPNAKPRRTIFRRSLTVAKYTGYVGLSAVFGLFVLGAGILVHDAFTYNERHIDRVPINPLALHPERGGPKNLPLVKVQIDDDDDEEMKKLAEKPRLVIVGGGWGAIGILQTLHPGDYHVTVVSAETFTTFTPLLPSAAVGTVQVRSLIEPIRKVIARLRGHFMVGKAVDISMIDRLLEVETVNTDGSKQHVYLPYDKLVIAVGSTSSTHGVPGLEHCFQLKTIADAQQVRRRIMDNFEVASLPTTSEEERKRLLSFVVCGGGPTGIETAAEIFDFCQEDIFNYFPKVCRADVSIHVIQSREHILNTYSEAISKYAEDKFERDGVNLIMNARVSAVNPTHVIYTIRKEDGEIEQHSIPTNFTLWSTGIAMNPFTRRLTDLLPNQVHRKAVEVDAHLRVKGAPLGEIYAIGDCATIETAIVPHFMELVDEADKDKNGKIDFEEFEVMVDRIKKKIPMASNHVAKVRELFEMYDTDADNNLSLNELVSLLEDLGNKITALPATAQVASQQGKYIGRTFNKLARQRAALEAKGLSDGLEAKDTDFKPFVYHHLGMLAYIGNAAVFDVGNFAFTGGLAAMYAWRSVYWNEQVSARTRALLMIDWIIRGIWGRDLSRL